MKVKRITALLLVFAMLFSFCPAVFADGKESKEEYGILPVTTFPSKRAYNIKMMVVGDEIYVKADMIAEILGYKYSSAGDYAVISNASIGRVIAFQTGSAKLRYINGIGGSEAIVFNYNMPYKAVSNDKGFWVPYLYTISLMDSCYLCTPQTLCQPRSTVLGQIADISRKKDSYKFDAVTDLGDSKARQKLCYLVTYLNGLNYLSGIDLTCISPITFEIKYIDQLATLFCSQSKDDIRDMVDDISLAYDTLNDTKSIQGIYKAADIMDKYADQKLEYAFNEFIMAMDTKEIRSSYVDDICTDLDRALDNKLFSMKASKATKKIKEGWEDIDNRNLANWLNISIQYALYAEELKKIDQNSVTAFKTFADYLNDGRDHNISSLSALTLSDYMNNADNKAYLLGKAIFSTLVNCFDDEVDIANGDLGDALLDSSSLYKLRWSLTERFWPPLREGLDNADKSTLLHYSEILQDESRRWYDESLDDLYFNPNDLDNWRQYVESTYTMLRMSYLSREIGCDIIQTYIDSGINTDADKDTLTKYEKSINTVSKKISADEAGYYRLIKSENDSKETDSVSSFYGMIPPVEAKVKKNYKASDAKVKPQIIFNTQPLVGEVVAYKDALYYWKITSITEYGTPVSNKLVCNKNGKESTVFDTSSIPDEWDYGGFYGEGKIAIANEKIFFTVSDIVGGCIYSCDLNGKNIKSLNGYEIKGLSLDGKYLIADAFVNAAEPDVWYYVIINTETNKVKTVDKKALYHIWAYNGYVYYVKYNKTMDAIELHKVSPEKLEDKKLCTIKASAEDEYSMPLIGQALYPVINGEEYVYFSFGDILGTGDFFSNSKIVRAKLDGSDFKVIDSSQEDETSTLFSVNKDGSVKFSDIYLRYQELQTNYYCADNKIYSIDPTNGMGNVIMTNDEYKSFTKNFPKYSNISVQSVDVFGNKAYIRVESQTEETVRDYIVNGGVLLEKNLDSGKVNLI